MLPRGQWKRLSTNIIPKKDETGIDDYYALGGEHHSHIGKFTNHEHIRRAGFLDGYFAFTKDHSIFSIR